MVSATTLRLKSSIADLRSARFYAALLGELIGVLFLVLIGCGSVLALGDKVGISLCFGISVATMVWCLASVSGGHINPAVTFGLLFARKISLMRAVLYVCFQLIGAVVGAAILKGVYYGQQLEEYKKLNATVRQESEFELSLGYTTLGAGVQPSTGLLVEFLVTFVLVFTVFATTDGSRSDLKGSGPLSIGLSVTMCHLAAIPLTGSSMNTARTFGPAVLGGGQYLNNHWVYWVGPILGGIVAGFLYEFIMADNASLSKFKSWLTDADYGAEDEEEAEGEGSDPRTSHRYEMKTTAEEP